MIQIAGVKLDRYLHFKQSKPKIIVFKLEDG